MKQKYSILKDGKTGSLTIQEYAELSKDMFSLVCEETYDKGTIESTMKEGRKALVNTLRTPNLYPISDYIDKIADTVTELYQKDAKQADPVELVFDDVDLFRKQEEEDETADEEDESVEIDDLLDDDDEEDDSEDSDKK